MVHALAMAETRIKTEMNRLESFENPLVMILIAIIAFNFILYEEWFRRRIYLLR